MLRCHCLLSATAAAPNPKMPSCHFELKSRFSDSLGSDEVEGKDKSYSTSCPWGYLAASLLLMLTQNAPLSLAVGDRLVGARTASQSRLPQKKLRWLTLQFPCTSARANVRSMNGSGFPRNMACQRATETNSDQG